MSILVIFAVSLALSTGAVALVIRFSHKKAWYDYIDERKNHSGDIPRLGGIGFAFAFIVVLSCLGIVFGGIEENLRFLPCFLAMIITLISGAIDDFRPMAPRYKLLLQFTAALCVIIPGFTFGRILYTGPGFLSDLGWLTYPVTFLWVVGLTNAINLIDGVDGLAGGLSAIIVFFFALIFFSFTNEASRSLLFCACLFGALAGFLVFNAPVPKAKIFMGDCGAQFLGFVLALLPLMKDHHQNGPSSLPVLYAAALLVIPIFDTTAAVWRRLRDGKKIYDPDKSHLHHKLIYLGLGARGVNAVLYSLQILIGILTFIAVRLDGLPSLCVLGSTYLTALVFFAVIHFMNRAVTARKKSEAAGKIPA
ncbi:MAG: undecaprenyl/decaprenyl-phosphate alpha-N-acetylglucosaminyl 1-phosphate transferase [Treponema sp.]|jgi:UDP-GlcNAc:undecaprenyl-phosphate GlcNAc-1-phosphate transferase|nr:undecaprenyl/decaprenyl-phosphate alpha-N-acetylglucosaminyl 1-phosphate transferase [Treponema sp.]